MGIASLILGVISLVIGFIPLCGVIALLPAIVGLILGITDVAIKSKNGEKKGQAVAGLIMSAIAIVIIIFWVFIASISNVDNSNYNEINVNLNKQNTIGRLTYYVPSNWEYKEEKNDNSIKRYYYPFDKTMFMVLVDTYYDNFDYHNFNEIFNECVKDLNKENYNLTSKITTINNNKCGIIKYIQNLDNVNYEFITYCLVCKNEVYTFTFSEQEKIEEKYIKFLEKIVLKIKIMYETEQEKQIRLEQEKIEKERKEQEIINNYKNSCLTYSYKEIARNPDNYKGKNVTFTGKIVQVMEGYLDSNSITLRIDVTKDKYGFWDDTIYCTYKYSQGESKLLEDDIIKLYGECKGTTSYTSIFGQKISLPEVQIKYVEIINE